MPIDNYIYNNTLPVDRLSYAGNGMYGTGLSYKSSDNPMYDAYYKANPYVGQTYRKTIWDNLFGGIFRTGYDKWLNEMQLNAAQYDASVVDLQQQNEYNDPSAEASRMREAGLNPDLQGLGDVAKSEGLTPDVQDAQIPDAIDLSQVASFAGMIGQCFEGALGMCSAGIDLIGKISQIDSQSISNSEKMQALALEYIRNSIPAEGLETDADYLSWREKLGALSTPDVAWKDSLARSLGLKKHQRKAFDLSLNNAIGSLPSELDRFKMDNEYTDNKLSSARNRQSSFYHQSFEVMKGISAELVASDDALQIILKRNAVKSEDLKDMQLENEMTKAGIEDQYLTYASEHGMGRTKAITEDEAFNLTKLQQSIDKQLKKTRKKILDMLEGMADNGNDFASYMIYNMMLHDYMNFEFKAKGELGIGKFLPKSVQGWLPNIGADVEFGASL